MEAFWLYDLFERNRADNQQFAHPFVVELETGDKVVVWFSYRILGKSLEELYANIPQVYVLDKEKKLSVYKVDLKIPAYFSEENPQRLSEYIANLVDIYDNYSIQKMEDVLQKHTYKPLYESYCRIKDYVISEMEDN